MKSLRILGSALALCIISFNAFAATVTLLGDDVSFTFDNSTLFGTGVVIGNNIFFQPTNFKAESLNGQGVVTANQTLNVTVQSITADYLMTEFALAEQGDYKLIGDDAFVDVSGQLRVTSQTALDPNNFPLAYLDTAIFNAGPLTTQDALTAWNAGASIDLADTAGWGSDTKVIVTIENLLTASTDSLGSQAFVEKKLGAVGVIVNPVPIPAAVWLFGSGLGLLGWMRRRRSVS